MGMSELELPYGHGVVQVRVPDAHLKGVLLPRQNSEPADEAVLLRAALAQPIGTARLREMVRSGQQVDIVTSDLTRPCPSERLLPLVLDELAAGGVRDEEVMVVLARGLHRPMTAGEVETAVGAEVYRRLRIVNHDPADCVRLGVTSAGTPVEIFRPLVEADFRICLGNLELHYFAGYSGGAKAVLPGCASRATLNANHALMVRPEARAGRLAGNPVRADLEEGAAMLGVDFVLNVVMDGHRLAGAVAGDVTAAHRRGCELVAARGIVEIERPADVVLVSAGGHPKDLNLYQAQKALDNAAYALRDGGVLILAAECPEGLGNATFEAWLTGATPDELLARIQQEFVLGGHKAAAVAAVLRRAAVYLVSALPDELVRRCGLTPFANLDAALAAALDESGPGASLLVLPQGGSILPQITAH
ncbi:MAG: nickel-dependent lactate racemase [Anaerolineae bacterium]|nr:nickel-dependent lactate racemase [Anaerolineae bacterium]